MDLKMTQDAVELQTYIEELEPKTAPSGGGETVLPLPIELKKH
jgi:hypothetical protein